MSDTGKKFSETYDKEGDVYYVTFKTGEPSYVMEFDDVLLLEMGMFTHMPTGFRVLNYSKHGHEGIVKELQKIKREIEGVMKDTKKNFPSIVRQRENQVENALDKVFA